MSTTYVRDKRGRFASPKDAPAPTQQAKTNHLSSRRHVRRGDLMYIGRWMKVENVRPDRLEVQDVDGGMSFQVVGEVQKSLTSADRYSTTEEISKTKAVHMLKHANNKPFTVCFVKASGQERRLRGRFIGIDKSDLGYIDVEDLDKPHGENRFRMVDCRTIKSIIMDDVFYTVG